MQKLSTITDLARHIEDLILDAKEAKKPALLLELETMQQVLGDSDLVADCRYCERQFEKCELDEGYCSKCGGRGREAREYEAYCASANDVSERA